MFEVSNLSCYIHLRCRVGPEPMCLDWRDICDVKTACLDDKSDAGDCLEVEMNVCSDDEFQCHNGQCILKEFFANDPANPDCLDGTDEIGPLVCLRDPSMRCEDRTTSFGYVLFGRGVMFNCGDGETAIIGDVDHCNNQRTRLFAKTLFSKLNNPLLSSQSLSAMIHYLLLNEELDVPENTKSPCYKIDGRCSAFILKHCPSLFAFPASPVLFAHVYFYYSNNQTISDFRSDTPARTLYVCYNESLCPSISWTIRINRSTCRPFNDFSNRSGWFDTLQDISRIFWSCLPNGSDERLSPRDGFFRCENASKCIPQRRLGDGIADCVNARDERADQSCNRTDPSRYSCKSESKCLSHLLLQDGYKDCERGDDEGGTIEWSDENFISFPTMCDGFHPRESSLVYERRFDRNG